MATTSLNIERPSTRPVGETETNPARHKQQASTQLEKRSTPSKSLDGKGRGTQAQEPHIPVEPDAPAPRRDALPRTLVDRKIQSLDDRLRTASRQQAYYRKQLIASKRTTDRLRTQLRSSERFQKDWLAADINADAHREHGNPLADAPRAASRSPGTLFDTLPPHLRERQHQPDRARGPRVVILGQELARRWAMRNHNRQMHALNGNIDGKPSRQSKQSQHKGDAQSAKRARAQASSHAAGGPKTPPHAAPQPTASPPRTPTPTMGQVRDASGASAPPACHSGAARPRSPPVIYVNLKQSKTKPAETKTGLKKKIDAAALAVAASLAESQAASLASLDAAKEVEDDEAEMEKQKRISAHHASLASSLDQFFQSITSLSTGDTTAFGNEQYSFALVWTPQSERVIDWAAGFDGLLPREILECLTVRRSAAARADDMNLPVCPHVILTCTFSRDCVEASKSAEEAEPADARATLPLMQKYSKLPLRDSLLTVHVRQEMFGWFWTPVGTVPLNDIKLPLETVLTVHQEHRLSYVSFDADFDVLDVYLGRTHDTILHDKYDLSQAGPLYVGVFAALLHSANTTAAVCTPDHYGYLNAKKVIYAALIRDRPSPAGTYFRGYDCRFIDIFPKDLHTPISSMIDSTCAIIQNAPANAVEAAKRAKAALGYACATPVHFTGVKPSFPAHTYSNELLAFVKRLGGSRVVVDRGPLSAVKVAVKRVLSERFVPVHIADSEIHERCLAHAHAKGFQENEVREYMHGVEEFLQGNPITDDLADMLGGVSAESKCFIKQETYPSTAIKAPRFIIAPNLFTRGYAHAAQMESQENYFTCLGVEHHAKHQTPDELRKFLKAAFDRLEWFAETDYTSFESNLDQDLLQFEWDILTTLYDGGRAAALDSFFNLVSRNTTVATSRDFTMYLRPMRRSGDDHTSAGNNIQNLLLTMYVLLPIQYPQLSHDDATPDQWYDALCQVFRDGFFKFEGDDGLFHLGHEPSSVEVASVMDRVSKCGVKLKFEFKRSGYDLHFCGNNLALTRDDRVIPLADWLDKVANATVCFGKISGDSNRSVFRVAYGKVVSYALTYPDAPVLGKFCRSAANWYREHSVLSKYFAAARRLAKAGYPLVPYLRADSTGSESDDPLHWSKLPRAFHEDGKLLAKFSREVRSEVSYFFMTAVDEPRARQFFGVDPIPAPPARPLRLNMISDPATAALQAMTRDALDEFEREADGLDARRAELIEREVSRAFAAADPNSDTLSITSDTLRRLYESRPGPQRVEAVHLEDARQQADQLAAAATQPRPGVPPLLRAAFEGARSNPMAVPFLNVIVGTVMPVLGSQLPFIGLMLLGSYLFCSFLIGLWINRFSLLRALRFTLIALLFSPLLYLVFLIGSVMLVIYDWYKRFKWLCYCAFSLVYMPLRMISRLLDQMDGRWGWSNRKRVLAHPFHSLYRCHGRGSLPAFALIMAQDVATAEHSSAWGCGVTFERVWSDDYLRDRVLCDLEDPSYRALVLRLHELFGSRALLLGPG